MEKQSLYKKLELKDRNLDQIADETVNDTGIIGYLIDGLSVDNPRIKYGCSNTLVIISKKHPELLYSFFELFVKQLGHDNKFIKWGAINIIANLTKVDTESKFDKIFSKYYSEIEGPVMITAANIVKWSAIIAKAKPYLTEKITEELLKVRAAEYQTPECKNVVLGHMISSFDSFFKQIENKEKVISLINAQKNNPRKPTRNKAEKFIKKWVKIK